MFKMSLDFLYVWILFDTFFRNCDSRTVVSRRVVQTIGYGPNSKVHRSSSVTRNIQPKSLLRGHSSWTSKSTHKARNSWAPTVHQHVVKSSGKHTTNRFSTGSIPDEALANMPPGTRIFTSKRYHVGNPYRPIATARTIVGPDGRETHHKHTKHQQNSVPKSFPKSWWSQTVPIKFNSSTSGINVSPTIPAGTSVRRRVWSSSFPLFTTNSSEVGFSVNDFLANLPPGAKVRVSGSSSVQIPGGTRINYNVFGPNSQEDFLRSGKPSKKDRNLPQPGKPIVTYSGGKGKTINEDEKYILLENHNKVRRAASPSAANMKKLIWDVELENSAQKYAKQCTWTHDKTRSTHGPYHYVGQNMHARRGARSIFGATSNWEAEKNNYNIHTGRCARGEMCGHYTQMVWADTETVGCAMWKCPYIHNLGWRNAYLIVCNYGPGGNTNGQKPYHIGQRCTKCDKEHPTCVDGLCS